MSLARACVCVCRRRAMSSPCVHWIFEGFSHNRAYCEGKEAAMGLAAGDLVRWGEDGVALPGPLCPAELFHTPAEAFLPESGACWTRPIAITATANAIVYRCPGGDARSSKLLASNCVVVEAACWDLCAVFPVQVPDGCGLSPGDIRARILDLDGLQQGACVKATKRKAPPRGGTQDTLVLIYGFQGYR